MLVTPFQEIQTASHEYTPLPRDTAAFGRVGMQHAPLRLLSDSTMFDFACAMWQYNSVVSLYSGGTILGRSF
jgi:hypothetical protein